MQIHFILSSMFPSKLRLTEFLCAYVRNCGVPKKNSRIFKTKYRKNGAFIDSQYDKHKAVVMYL